MFASDVESSHEAAALRLVSGEPGRVVVGPVVFGGVRFWAAIEIDAVEEQRRRDDGVGALADPAAMEGHRAAGSGAAIRLVGCLVHERDPAHSLRLASLLAGYAPRSILVEETDDVLGISVEAALLDQGVILRRPDGRLDVMATPGARVVGSRGPDDRRDRRESALLETVYAAWLADVGAAGHAGHTIVAAPGEALGVTPMR